MFVYILQKPTKQVVTGLIDDGQSGCLWIFSCFMLMSQSRVFEFGEK